MGGSRKKKVLVAFAVLILVAVAVILTITYWPVNTGTLAAQFESQRELLKADSTAYNEISNFQQSYVTQIEGEKKDQYVAEAYSLVQVLDSLRYGFDFYSVEVVNSISSGLNKSQIKSISNKLSTAQKNIEDMADYISKSKAKLTNSSLIIVGWQAVRDYYKDALKNYCESIQEFYKLCSDAELKGVYGNELSLLTIKGESAYLNVIYSLVFERDIENFNLLKNIAERASGFSKFYTSDNVDLIRDYYLNSNVQENVETISKLEENTDKKVNFEYLIQDSNYISLALSTEANKSMSRSVKFLTCVKEGGVE